MGFDEDPSSDGHRRGTEKGLERGPVTTWVCHRTIAVDGRSGDGGAQPRMEAFGVAVVAAATAAAGLQGAGIRRMSETQYGFLAFGIVDRGHVVSK